MSLATRCPNCQTLFKVSAGQLQVHQGQVRCGQCNSVFSGIEYLTASDSQIWQDLHLDGPANSPPETQPTATDFLTRRDRPARHGLATRLRLPSLSPANRRWAMLALLLAVLQTAWWARHPLLVHLPAQAANWPMPSWLAHATAAPASTALVIDGSGFQAMDETHVRVEITLRNTLNWPSQWPAFRVRLTDPQGSEIASLVLAPADYQLRDGPPAAQASPLKGQHTIELLAYLNLQDLQAQFPENGATGFQLSLLDRP
ncbi:MAG: DUF3426 domain-containing protein [Limnobacter sp.]|uniref:DUF3426 domain-containing protein n=1 Tax=Limnobacter sp. TaxID=2003368 RepID=UPI00391DEA92